MSDETTALTETETQPPAIAEKSVPGLFNFTDFASAWDAAEKLCSTSLIPTQFRGKPAEVLAAWQYGTELGLPPMQALTAVAVINGTPSLYGDGFMAVVQSSPDFEDCVETFDEKTNTATCVMRRRGRSDVTRSFSEKDAKLAKLWGKSGPWTQYPKRMLQLRARAFAGRDAFADVLRGMVMADEARDRAPAVKDVEAVPVTPGVGDEHVSKARRVLDALPVVEDTSTDEAATAASEDPDMPIDTPDTSAGEASEAVAADPSEPSPPMKNFNRAIRHAPNAEALDQLRKVIQETTALNDGEKHELETQLAERYNELDNAE